MDLLQLEKQVIMEAAGPRSEALFSRHFSSETEAQELFNWCEKQRRRKAPMYKIDMITLCLKAIRNNDEVLLQKILDLDVDCDEKIDYQGKRITLVMAAVQYGKVKMGT